MGQTREALGVGVEQQHSECDGRKPEGKAIQLRGGQNKDSAGDDDEGANKRGREISSGNSAGTGTGIGGIDGSVGEPVESHGRGAGGEHRDDDPYKLMRTGKAGSGEHGSAESERESEDGVLPLDHFERNAQVAQDGHRKFVRQGRRFSSQNPEWTIVGDRQVAPALGPAAVFCELLSGTPKNENGGRVRASCYLRCYPWL